MKDKENKKLPECESKRSDDNKVVFIPLEDIRVIENVLNNWESLKIVQLKH